MSSIRIQTSFDNCVRQVWTVKSFKMSDAFWQIIWRDWSNCQNQYYRWFNQHHLKSPAFFLHSWPSKYLSKVSFFFLHFALATAFPKKTLIQYSEVKQIGKKLPAEMQKKAFWQKLNKTYQNYLKYGSHIQSNSFQVYLKVTFWYFIDYSSWFS